MKSKCLIAKEQSGRVILDTASGPNEMKRTVGPCHQDVTAGNKMLRRVLCSRRKGLRFSRHEAVKPHGADLEYADFLRRWRTIDAPRTPTSVDALERASEPSHGAIDVR